MQSIISVSNLEKTYATGFQALKRINLDIKRGEIFALLGPNGAGKTTAVQILSSLVRPDGGEVRVAGHDLAREPDAVPSDGSVESLRALIDRLDDAQIKVGSLSVHTPDLDDVFLALTGQPKEEAL